MLSNWCDGLMVRTSVHMEAGGEINYSVNVNSVISVIAYGTERHHQIALNGTTTHRKSTERGQLAVHFLKIPTYSIYLMPLLKAGLCPLLAQNVVDKLAAHGIIRVIDFVCTEPAKITSQCEVPYKSVLSIRRVLLAQYSSFPLNGVNLYDESVATLSILSTRCPELDDLLCSGIFTGEVTEIRGPTATGKTQLCMILAVGIAEDLSKNVIYVDSSCGFSPERTAELIKGSSDEMKHVSEALSRIRVSKCKSAYHLLDILSTIRTMLNSPDDRFSQGLKAIVVDSVSAAVEPTLKDLSYLESQSLLTSVKKELNSLAKDFTLAAVVTTESYTAEGRKNWFKTPMGHTWSTAASTQLVLERSTGLEMLELPIKAGMVIPRPVKITVLKSSHAKEGSSFTLNINKEGLSPV